MVRRFPHVRHGHTRATPRTLRVPRSATHRGGDGLRGRRALSTGGGGQRAVGMFGMPHALERVSHSGPRHGQPFRISVRHRCRADRSPTARGVPSREPVVRDADPQHSSMDAGRGDLEGHTPRAAARIGSHPDPDGDRHRVAAERRRLLVGLLVGVERSLRLDGGSIAPTARRPPGGVRVRGAFVLIAVA